MYYQKQIARPFGLSQSIKPSTLSHMQSFPFPLHEVSDATFLGFNSTNWWALLAFFVSFAAALCIIGCMIWSLSNILTNKKPKSKQWLFLGFTFVMMLLCSVLTDRLPICFQPNTSLIYQESRFDCTNTVSMRRIDFKRFINEGGHIEQTQPHTIPQ
ncbi:MAG: hypothetical protein RIT04_294 [Candidatus Parcubacteria bacterium]|jgi:magnesium-transporting ATPase (P-type)